MTRLPRSTPALNHDERLGAYVIETSRNLSSPHPEKVWFNTITRQALPLDADRSELRAGFFLDGQQHEALLSRLFEARETLTLTAIVTWRCNLRCTHCTVIHRLEREDAASIDPERLADFVRRYHDARPNVKRLKLSLLGGEPLLNTDLCRRLVESTRSIFPDALYDITTNGAVRLEECHLELLRMMQDITVSLDGAEELNNTQRKAHRAKFNPYQRTMAFLEELNSHGLIDKVLVQGAIRDEYSTLENMADFYRALMAVGVRYDRIHFGSIHPTKSGMKAQESFRASLEHPTLRHQACCKFRGGHNLIIDADESVVSDYYDWETLGALDDPIQDLLERHHRMAVDTMPALSDPVCRTCPVIGYCWGGCTNARPLVGGAPSEYCNQDALIAKIREMAAEGSLPMDSSPSSCASDCGPASRNSAAAASKSRPLPGSQLP